MTATRSAMLACVLTLCAAAPASATTFAVLLQGQDNTAECAVGFGKEGFRVEKIRVMIPPSVLDRPLLLTIDTAPAMPQGISGLPGDFYPFALTLTDPADGRIVTPFTDVVDVCFNATTRDDKKLCLAYIDESKSPPEWKCEDASMIRDSGGYLCGTTNHFTIFALAETAAVPEPVAVAWLAPAVTLLTRRRR
jgi:hypothetical protein